MGSIVLLIMLLITIISSSRADEKLSTNMAWNDWVGAFLVIIPFWWIFIAFRSHNYKKNLEYKRSVQLLSVSFLSAFFWIIVIASAGGY